jgi:hypothetical protein
MSILTKVEAKIFSTILRVFGDFTARYNAGCSELDARIRAAIR